MKTRRNIVLVSVLAGLLAVSGSATATGIQVAQAAPHAAARIDHVLLLSVDGLHAIDLASYISAHPGSTLARLAGTGITYPHASTSEPSDSFPGLLAEVTGGTPRSTGVYYDDSYDRSLAAPGTGYSAQGPRPSTMNLSTRILI